MRNSPARHAAGAPGTIAVISLSGAVPGESTAECDELESLLAGPVDQLQSSNPVLVGRASASLRRHLDPARSNLLRGLTISDSDSVLEVGAEAGALTRYLGEVAGLVDALESNSRLAALAQLRTRDLDSVQIFAGDVWELPVEPSYSVIVAVDLIRRERTADARAAVLHRLRELLLPGGTIVLAESNRLGTKYLLGSPDDVTGRVFDSIENYPYGDESRAASHSELENALGAAGLQREYLPALPDHTFTRTVIRSSALPAELSSLTANLGILPSPDLAGPRPKLADERLVWPQLVDNGMDVALANSWLVLVTIDGPSGLLSPSTLATYEGWQRAARYTPHTVVHRDESGAVTFNRVYPALSAESALVVEDSVRPYLPGRSLLDDMVEAPFAELLPLLETWRAVVEDQTKDRVWLDLHPGNFVIGNDGVIRPIDLEFASASHDLDYVLRRGLVFTARSLAMSRPPQSFPKDIEKIGDLALHLGLLLGFEPATRWLERTLNEEAVLQTEVSGERGAGTTVEQRAAGLRAQFDTVLTNLPLGPRLFDQVDVTAKERDEAHIRLGIFGDRIQVLEQRESELERRETELEASVAAERSNAVNAANHIEILTDQLQHTSRELASAYTSRALLSRHIESLENEIQEIRAAARATEIELRTDIHHRHLRNEDLRAIEELHQSRAVQMALRLRRAAERTLPGNSRRRNLVGRVVRTVRRR